MRTKKLSLTSKVRIYPNEEQSKLIRITAKAYVKAANYVSGIVHKYNIRTHREARDITYNILRKEYALKSQMACEVNRHVVANYKTMDENGVLNTLAKYKSKTYKLVRDRNYSFVDNGNKISLGVLNGRVKVPFNAKGVEHFFDGQWTFGGATIVERNKKFYMHISATKEIPSPNLDEIDNIVGIDLGINFVATYFDSNGKTHFISGKEIKQKRAKFKELRKQLQRRKTASARRRLKAIGERENRWMTDVNHQITKALVQQYGKNTLFVLEDLDGIRGALTKVRRNNRYVTVSWAYAELREMLSYKAKLKGSKVALVCPKYTSQDCPKCNKRDKYAREHKFSLYSCKNCNYKTNDDRVGAMNLYAKGVQLYLNDKTVKMPA